MTLHAQFTAGAAAPLPPAPAVAAQVVTLSPERSAVFFDTAERAPRLAATRNGLPFGGPALATRLGREAGGTRQVLILGVAAAELCRGGLELAAEGRLVARIDPLALQSPLAEPAALLAGLATEGRLRLLKLCLTTGASLFAGGGIAGFGTLTGRLLEGLAPPLIAPASWCPVGRQAGIASFRLPAGTPPARFRDLSVIVAGRVSRFTDFETACEPDGPDGPDGPRLLHLLLRRRLPEGAELVAFADRPLRLEAPVAAAARPLAPWLAARPAALRLRSLAWLADVARADPEAAALAGELACAPADAPEARLLHLSATGDGLLFLAAIHDPRGLVASLRLRTAEGSVDAPCATLDWHPTHGTVLAGFAPLAATPGLPVELALVLRSGRVRALPPAEPAPFAGGVAEPFRALPTERVAPPLARALVGARRGRGAPRVRVRAFGAAPARPLLAVVAVPGPAAEYLHALFAALAAEPEAAAIELVLVHPDGPASGPVERAAALLHAVHGRALLVVAVAPDAAPSECLRRGLAATRAPAVLCLDRSALPDAPGWASLWRAHLARRRGAVLAPGAVHAPGGRCAGDGGPAATAPSGDAASEPAVSLSVSPTSPEAAKRGSRRGRGTPPGGADPSSQRGAGPAAHRAVRENPRPHADTPGFNASRGTDAVLRRPLEPLDGACIGLNAAARAVVIAAPPALAGTAADLLALPGLRRLGPPPAPFTAYAGDGPADATAAAAEALAVQLLRDRRV